MNSLFRMFVIATETLLLGACMNVTVDDVDISGMENKGITNFDGSIYEYLKNGDPDLGVTFDSLRYILEYYTPEEANEKKLKIQELKACLEDLEGEYTLMAVPDSCFKKALQNLNLYRKMNSLVPITIGEEGDKQKINELTLEHVLTYSKSVPRYDVTDPEVIVKTDIYEYSQGLDSLVCRYVLSGIYDTPSLNLQKTNIVSSLFYDYRMNLQIDYSSASGYVNGGIKKVTYYDMHNTLETTKWEKTEAKWMDVYAKNGVIHVLIPEHEFGYGEFLEKFKKMGHEE